MKNKPLIIILITVLLLAAITITVTRPGPNILRSEAAYVIPAADTAQLPRDTAHIRALRNIHFEPGAERTARGGYLANSILMCFTCHSPRDWKSPGAPPIEEKKGSGGTIVAQDSFSLAVAPNLTPDRETGAGNWTDDMLARAIREGVGHDGRVLNWNMPWYSFRALADEDLAAVIVYLRSLPAIRSNNPKTYFKDEDRSAMLQNLAPLTSVVTAPDQSTPQKRGAYLVKLGECIGCHTSHSEFNPGLFGGGNFITRWRQGTWSANITPDSSGIHYGLAAFQMVLRSGKGGTLGPAMPWAAFRNLNDHDLAAIYAYLKALPPARHFVSSQKPFTKCEICGESHGLGEFNKRRLPKGVPPPTGSLAKYTGIFDDASHGGHWEITISKNKLYAQMNEKAPKQPVIFTSDSAFLIPGWVLPMYFKKDSTGKITGLGEATDYGGDYVRKK